MEPLLSCRSLCCGYPGRTVLRDVGFDLCPGQVVALLGPNGSGKSTLLRTLVRSVRPLGGTIALGGDDLPSIPVRELAQRLAFVPQEEHAPFPFSGLQIVLMGRLSRSTGLADTDEDLRVARWALEEADASEFADRPITELSGGERQRLLIARALASEARVLLLDEPTSHLDAAHLIGLVVLLRRLAAEGRAVIAAVHDLNVASALGGRALLLGGGSVRAEGSVAEVLLSPRLEEVYGIDFERIPGADGQLRVFPSLPPALQPEGAR